MATAGFLDTGVYVGYCFTVDRHHKPCSAYIDDQQDLLFTSETVLQEYSRAKRKSNTRYADAVRKHISDVKRSDLSGTLGPMDLNRLKTDVLDRRNPLHDVLLEIYENGPQFIDYDEMLERLTNLQRDIERLAIHRKAELDSMVDTWEQKAEYPDVTHELDLHEPDLTICVEGHDLATHLEADTELATTNSRDFVDDGQRSHILAHTAYRDVVDCSG